MPIVHDEKDKFIDLGICRYTAGVTVRQVLLVAPAFSHLLMGTQIIAVDRSYDEESHRMSVLSSVTVFDNDQNDIVSFVLAGAHKSSLKELDRVKAVITEKILQYS